MMCDVYLIYDNSNDENQIPGVGATTEALALAQTVKENTTAL